LPSLTLFDRPPCPNSQIERDDLRDALTQLDSRLYTTEQNLQELFDQLEKNASGGLSLDDFKTLAKLAEACCRVIDAVDLAEVEAIELEEGRPHHRDPDIDDATLRILTRTTAAHRGRVYLYSLPYRKCMDWVERLERAVKEAKLDAANREFLSLYGGSKFEMFRAKTRQMHESHAFSIVLAFFIVVGFLTDIAEAQIMPGNENKSAEEVFMYLDMAITLVFVGELAINLFAHSNDRFQPFLSRPANWLLLVDLLGAHDAVVLLLGHLLGA
jgi:hypothetical protein